MRSSKLAPAPWNGKPVSHSYTGSAVLLPCAALLPREPAVAVLREGSWTVRRAVVLYHSLGPVSLRHLVLSRGEAHCWVAAERSAFPGPLTQPVRCRVLGEKRPERSGLLLGNKVQVVNACGMGVCHPHRGAGVTTGWPKGQGGLVRAYPAAVSIAIRPWSLHAGWND